MYRPMWCFIVCLLAAIPFVSGCPSSKTAPPPKDADSDSQPQKEQHAASIREVLRLDKQYAGQADQDARRDRVLATRTLVRNMQNIDLLKCPTEFQDAYLKHCYAWADLVPLVEKYDGFSGSLMAFVEGLSGQYKGDIELARIRKNIADTVYEVERISLRYGVQAKH